MNLLMGKLSQISTLRKWMMIVNIVCVWHFTGFAQNQAEIDKILELLDDHNYRQAYNLASVLNKTYPDNCKVLLYKGISEYQMQQYDSAVWHLNKAMALCRSNRSMREQRNLNYLFLAKSYHAKGQFSEAITYLNYLDRKSSSNALRAETSLWRSYCKNAMQLIHTPIDVKIEPLKVLNTPSDEIRPVLTSDESMIYFSSNRPGSMGGRIAGDGKFYHDVYVAYRDSNGWRLPNRCDEGFNTPAHEFFASLSADENLAYITRNLAFNSEIVAINIDKSGQNSNFITLLSLNTNSNEADLSVASNGKILVYSSDRKGTIGGFDLFFMQQNADGAWSQPQNIGQEINTSSDEISPFLVANGDLYFCSQGHNSIGGFDIFYAKYKGNGQWHTPVNMGYPLNTVSDENSISVGANSKQLFFSRLTNGHFDLYCASIKQNELHSQFLIKGVIAQTNGPLQADQLQLVDTDNVLISNYFLNKSTGKFIMNAEVNKDYKLMILKEETVLDYRMLRIEPTENMIPDKLNIFMLDTIFIQPNLQISTDSVVSDNTTDTLNHQNKSLIRYKVVENFVEKSENLEAEQHRLITKLYDDWFGKWYESMNISSQNFLMKDIYFSTNSYEIISSEPELLKISDFLKTDHSFKLYIIGHTDEDGDSAYNYSLSEKRCDAVYRFLVNSGVKENQLIKVAKGANMPFINKKAAADSESQLLSYNRRVEFFIETREGVHTYAIVPEIPPDIVNEAYLKDSLTSGYKVVFFAKEAGHTIPGFLISSSDDKFLISVNLLNYKQAFALVADLKLKQTGIPFIVRAHAMHNPENVNNLFYSIYLISSDKPLPDTMFSGLEDVNRIIDETGNYIYFCGKFVNLEQAEMARIHAQENGFKSSFIFINTYLEK